MHPSIQRAYEILDRLKDFEPAPRDPSADDAIEAWRQSMPPQRSVSSDQMVYKTYGLDERMPQQQSATMDAVTAKQWNDWAVNIARDMSAATFEHNIKKFADAFIDATAEAMSERDAKLRGEIAELRKEWMQLRKEWTQLRDDPPVAVLIDGKPTKMRRGR